MSEFLNVNLTSASGNAGRYATQSNPMKLQASNGNSFDLQIIGYQFPDNTDCEYDANWLIIDIDVIHPDGRWRVRNPSMLTTEVATLSRWLRHHNQTYNKTQSCGFIEPNLEFRFSDDRETLAVYFDLESRPDWIPDKYNFDGDVFVDFPTAQLNLQSAADDLDRQLLQFPERGIRKSH
ncbi:MAG: hypothetical protein GY768_29620 [Planctomycetaceae bacterium]|nr:hypothetical protein [Planctomycetaceae bacterium]